MEIEPKTSPNRNPRSGHATDHHLLVKPAAGIGIWLSWVALALLVLRTARALHPDPHGLGTHTQLGLPACFFLQWSGLPCPSCGLTTCFSLLARGELRAGFLGNPVGGLLFTLTCASVPLAIVAAARGASPAAVLSHPQARLVCTALACALLVQWVLRIFPLQ